MRIVRRHLESNGAQVVESINDFSRPSIPKIGQGLYIMVPYQTPILDIPSTDEMAFECEVVTDMWLERCLHARAMVSPESHVASTPFPKFPIEGMLLPNNLFRGALTMSGFSEMRICSTGFGGIDLLHVSKLVNLIGASYDEVLTPKASVLICNDPKSANVEKVRHTREWRVPAVSADWLWISIQTGQKKPFEPYIVRQRTSQISGSLERPGDAFANDEHSPQQAVQKRDDNSLSSAETINGKFTSGKRSRTQTLPIISDGFSNEDRSNQSNQSKPTVPESRDPSPSTTADKPTTQRSSQPPEPNHSAPSALDTALKDLLQQAQAARSRKSREITNGNGDATYPARRKRKPLLGRALSHSSTKVFDTTKATSRASSVDTLNDDGLGTTIESTTQTRDNSLSRTNSRNDQGFSSMLSGGKFDFLADNLPPHAENVQDEENQEPQLTQLDYEDADAAAMRAEFLRDAGKLPTKMAQADQGLRLGEVREMEDIGWGSGRRTRKHPLKLDDF